jgi:hypothetical protein
MPTILDIVRDLYPALFAGDSYAAWRAALATLFALPMSDAEAHIYRACTGRQRPPERPALEGWFVIGRRGGKSLVMALVAVYMTCFRMYRLGPGERGVFMVIAADRRQARVVKRYISGLLRAVPMLEVLIARETKEAIELTNQLTIEIHTASFRAVRGYTVVGAVCDEIAFWPNDDAADSDSEILNALRPAMATVPDALLLAISSPYARRGELWDAYEKHYGRDGDPILVWQAPTKAMNPTVPDAVIARAYEKDEAIAAAEYGAQFRRDIERFVGLEALDAVTVRGRFELPRTAGVTYEAFVDVAGGSGGDSFTLAIGHATDECRVVDTVLEIRPPFSPDDAVKECAERCRAYGVGEVRGDRYAGEWPAERFRVHGIGYRLAELSKSELYREALPLINSGRVELLDLPRLRQQLLGLERRTGRSGRDSIDHAPNGRDDVGNAVCGLLASMGQRREYRIRSFAPTAFHGFPVGI